MPGGNGKGPRVAGQGRGEMGGPFAAGPVGNCVCPGCGYTTPHVPGRPCNKEPCPRCGMTMVRE